MIPGIESLACGPLAVPDEVMAHVVQVESARNPFAIGVVGGRLERQPRSLEEATATVAMLEQEGRNYSVGLAQVNRTHFARLGWSDPARAFDACGNLKAGAEILADCLQRNGGRWGDAFSCYYSGNPRTGYEHGYVQRVVASMADDTQGVDGDAPVAPPVGLAAQRTSAPAASRSEEGITRSRPFVATLSAPVPIPPPPSAAVGEARAEDPARVF